MAKRTTSLSLSFSQSLSAKKECIRKATDDTLSCVLPKPKPEHRPSSSSSLPPCHLKTRKQVDASFAASLLRVVPFDDYPSPPPSDDFLAHDVSSTTLPHAASTGEPGRSSASPGGTKDGDVVLAGSALRGGDVVRICHLTSAGFLTHEAVPTTPPRPSRAADDNVVIDEDITARIEVSTFANLNCGGSGGLGTGRGRGTRES